jgi:hypothetical protein
VFRRLVSRFTVVLPTRQAAANSRAAANTIKWQRNTKQRSANSIEAPRRSSRKTGIARDYLGEIKSARMFLDGIVDDLSNKVLIELSRQS